MSRIVQEKFQVDYAQNHNDDAQSGWMTDASARVRKGAPGPKETRGTTCSTDAFLYNGLPPGADIVDQEMADIRTMHFSANNMGTGDQVTVDVTPTSARTGFDRKKLLSTDDAYTREHNDAFYDDPVVDGQTGFIERNNMLDRM